MEYQIRISKDDVSNKHGQNSLSFNLHTAGAVLPFKCEEVVEDWIYSVRIESKWYNVYVENNTIKFKDDVIIRVYNKIAELCIDDYYTTTLVISYDEVFKRNLLKHGKSNGLVAPVVDDSKVKHLEEDVKVLKTKNAILENKLKYFESELDLIKRQLGF